MVGTALEPEIRALLDKQAIHEVLLHYCRAVDRLDAELLRSTYWPDAWDEHGGLFSGSRDDFILWVLDYQRNQMESSVHEIGHPIVQLAGDRAFCETRYTGYYMLTRVGGLYSRISCGRYIDIFERRGDEWRIAHRTVVSDWGRMDPAEPPASGRIRGCRSHEDPLYLLHEKYLSSAITRNPAAIK